MIHAPTFLKKKRETHTVNGEELAFYGLRIQVLADLRDLGRPLAKAFTTLFSIGVGARDKVVKEFKTPQKVRLERFDGQANSFEDIAVLDQGSEKVDQAMSIEMSKHVLEQRSASVDEMIRVFTDPANRFVVGRTIMSSLRDHYPSLKMITAQEVSWFMEGKDGDEDNYPGVDAPTLVQLLIGVCKANFGWFKDVEGKLKAVVEEKVSTVMESLKSKTEAPSTSETPMTPVGST